MPKLKVKTKPIYCAWVILGWWQQLRSKPCSTQGKIAKMTAERCYQDRLEIMKASGLIRDYDFPNKINGKPWVTGDFYGVGK